MSITINGATNTLTAASGLTIAGNTAVAGTLSATGVVTASAGAVGAPAITFGDATTGIYRPAANRVGLAISGGLRAQCLSTGFIAYGALDVVGDAASGQVASMLGSTGYGLKFVTSAVGPFTSYITVGGGEQLGLAVAGTSYLTVSATGAAVTGTLSVSSHILPTIDNTSNLGSAALGMKELFSDNGTINTSDARRKTEVSALSAAEINAAKQLAKEIGSFKFLASVAEKGDAARLHIGMTVQRAIEIMEANDLDPFAYSFICYDAWGDVFIDHPAIEAVAAQEAVLDEDGTVITPAIEAVAAADAWTEQTQVAGDKYSFRVHELLLFMAAGFEARLAALEAA